MTWDLPLIALVRELVARCERDDSATDTLTLSGDGGSLAALRSAVLALQSRGHFFPLRAGGMPVGLDEILATDHWSLIAHKDALISAMGFQSQAGERVVLFLSPGAFNGWAQRQLALAQGYAWQDRLTILVDGLHGAVFGPYLRCGGVGSDLPQFDPSGSKFSAKAVSALVRLPREALSREVGQTMLSGGDLASDAFVGLRLWAERDTAQLLCNEVIQRGGRYEALLRGGRSVSMQLDIPSAAPSREELELLLEAAGWCFAEHRDARHSLLVDRLALDAKEGASFITFLRESLGSSFQDARDRYRLVVIEKKDAAIKETRDILKEVRAQADAYASKVRDLTATFLRDLLAALLLIGLGLLGRMNSNGLEKLVDSSAVDVFFKVLAAYFVLSAVVQISSHWRDLHLTTAELQRWWGISRSSLPGSEVDRILTDVIAPRRRTFYVAVGVVAMFNLLLAGALVNWKVLLEAVLASQGSG